MIEIPSLTTLDPTAVSSAYSLLLQRLREYAPDLELRRGVLHDVVLRLEAALQTASRNQAALIDRSNSLADLATSPTLTDAGLADAVASNFRVLRRAAVKATGTVRVVLSARIALTVPAGFTFTSAGLRFVTDRAFQVKTTEAALASDNDRLLRAYGADRWAFTVPVTASVTGPGSVAAGTALSLGGALPSAVAAYASTDLSGGSSAETNTELATRLLAGISVRDASTAAGLAGRAQAAYAAVREASVIGHGDPEQVRYHALYPIAFGGRVDVYVRTALLPSTLSVATTATLIEQTSSGNTWQLSVTRDDAPGFYEPVKVVRDGDAVESKPGYPFLEDVRGLDLTDGGPDLTSALEAAYSRYQTGVFRFLDADADGEVLSVGAERDYTVLLRAMPLIAELQTLLADPAAAPAGGDLVVRAPVPCFVAVSLEVRRRASETAPDLDKLRQAVAAAVNALGFPGRLSASVVASAALAALPSGQTAGAIDLTGRFRYPDGSSHTLHSAEALIVPDEPSRMVSARTVAFLLAPEDVTVTAVVT